MRVKFYLFIERLDLLLHLFLFFQMHFGLLFSGQTHYRKLATILNLFAKGGLVLNLDERLL